VEGITMEIIGKLDKEEVEIDFDHESEEEEKEEIDEELLEK